MLPCDYNAATVDTALVLQLLRTPPSILLSGWMLPLFSGCCGRYPFLLVWTMTLYAAGSVYAAYTLHLGWVLPLFSCCCRHGRRHVLCCWTATNLYIFLLLGTQKSILLLVGTPQQYFCLHRSLTRRTPFRPRPPPPLPSPKWCLPVTKLVTLAGCGRLRAPAKMTSTRNVYARDPAPRKWGNSRDGGFRWRDFGGIATPPPRTKRDQEEESLLREETEAEQSPSGSEAHQRQPSPGSVERQRLISPSSTACQRQGSSHDRDTHDGSLTSVEELELTRRAHQRARETTLRRRQRLHQMQRDMEAAERAEKEATVATTRAQEAVNRGERARDSVAASTPPPPLRVNRESARGWNDQGTLPS